MLDGANRCLQGFHALGFTFFKCADGLCCVVGCLCFNLGSLCLLGERYHFAQLLNLCIGRYLAGKYLANGFCLAQQSFRFFLLLACIGQAIVALAIAFLNETLNDTQFTLHFTHNRSNAASFKTSRNGCIIHVLIERAQLIFFLHICFCKRYHWRVAGIYVEHRFFAKHFSGQHRQIFVEWFFEIVVDDDALFTTFVDESHFLTKRNGLVERRDLHRNFVHGRAVFGNYLEGVLSRLRHIHDILACIVRVAVTNTTLGVRFQNLDTNLVLLGVNFAHIHSLEIHNLEWSGLNHYAVNV